MDPKQWFGNMVADAYASEFASRFVIPAKPRADGAVADATARLVISGIVAIEKTWRHRVCTGKEE